MKKLTAFFLALLLLTSLGLPAFAAEGEENPQSEGGETTCQHSYDNACDTTCNSCGDIRSIQHSFGSWADAGGGSHSRTCSVCNHQETGTHTVSSWTAGDAAHTGTCSVCSASVSASHSFGSWTSAETGHSRSCSACGKTETGSHSWNGGAVTTEPSCVAGVRTYTCTVCSGTKTESIAATGHAYRNPTSTGSEKHRSTCIGCGDVLEQNHSWSGGTVTTQPTCVSTGVKTFTCSVCSATKTDQVEKTTTHDWNAWTTTDTTHSRTCKHCPETQSGNHAWSAYVQTEAPTCRQTGTKKRTCTTCGKEEIAVVDKLTTHTYDNDCDDTCNVCEEKREVEHKFYNYYTYNSTYHWYTCQICKTTKGKELHVPGPAPTEDKGQVCLDCKYELQPKLKHKHEYKEGDWHSDEKGHWHECDDCGVEVDFDSHTYGGKCGSTCTVCNYDNPGGHIYDGTYQTDKFSHWQICTVCDLASPLEEHVPGQEATAGSPQTCKVCHYILSEFVEHSHVPGEWISNQAEHWRSCECGETMDAGEHTWGDGMLDKGKKTVTYTCQDCGFEKTEDAPQKKGVAPWVILLAVLVVAFIATLALLIRVIIISRRPGKFSG